MLDEPVEEPVSADLAHPAGDRCVGEHRVREAVGDNDAPALGADPELLGQRHDRRCPVQVVRVRDPERPVDERAGRLNRLSGAGDRPLDHRGDGEIGWPERLDVRHELVLHLFPDDQDDAVEAGGDRVAGGEVHDRLARRPHGRELLEAAEPAPVTGCEDDELHD